MKKLFIAVLISAITPSLHAQHTSNDLFPDGSLIASWFGDSAKIDVNDLGKKFLITDYGAESDSVRLQTQIIQAVIDEAAKQGGGVVVVPEGVFLSGALFFKPKTHLHIEDGGEIRGSDNIENYPLMPSRMEGQSIDYFPALINAYGVDGFTITGKGTINGNGLRYWIAFWDRRKENPACTNLEVSRPRLIFIQHSKDVQLQDVRLINSGFWTSHYYKCENVKLIDLYIFSPHQPVKAPSTDAIDIDACKNVLIKGCTMSVNDDAIALKGGKGPNADKDENNGPNRNILIENCTFGFCHSALTFGSESIDSRNVLMRNCYVNNAVRLLWFKMRPDTPQKYAFVKLENIHGNARMFINVYAWKQFFDLKGGTENIKSSCHNVTMKNIDFTCTSFYAIEASPDIELSDFTFENLTIKAENDAVNKDLIQGLNFKNVIVNDKNIE